jgi:formyl-CoA transferase
MILIAANQDTVWRRLAQAMERPDLAVDARYATHNARGRVQQELDDLIAAWSKTIDAEPLLARMEEFGVPAGRIYRAPDMLADPHFAARQSIVSILHPDFGPLAMQNVAPRLSETPGEIVHVGPALGADTEDVLGGLLGMTAAQLADLRDRGVI